LNRAAADFSSAGRSASIFLGHDQKIIGRSGGAGYGGKVPLRRDHVHLLGGTELAALLLL
jgi:hypothetical protein